MFTGMDLEAAGCEGGRSCGDDWQRAHRELQRIGRARTRLELEEGHWLLAAQRGGAHWRLGYASFVEYAERVLGHSPRATRERLRVAAALEGLPETAAAVREGRLAWSAARELTRVATRENERQWLEATVEQTLRQIERAVSGRQPGACPNEPRDVAAERHVVRFELNADAYATLREALGKLRREAGGGLDDDAAILQMARQVLGGSGEGRASYQIAVSVCAECGRAEQEASGRQVVLGPVAREMAECDAQHVAGDAKHVASMDRDESRDAQAESRDAQSESCDEPTMPRVGRRTVPVATQTIPPAIRRLVMRRDHARCQVPGCQHALFCDVHHITPRSEGGQHDPDQLVVLCTAHHRLVHAGRLVIEGSVSAGLTFRHADGTPYGRNLRPTSVDHAASVFAALRGMGFREGEARAALREIGSAHVGPPPGVEAMLREALDHLTARVAVVHRRAC